MLSVTGLNHFYYVRDSSDMRCKHSRVLSIIRERLHREPVDGDKRQKARKDEKKDDSADREDEKDKFDGTEGTVSTKSVQENPKEENPLKP